MLWLIWSDIVQNEREDKFNIFGDIDFILSLKWMIRSHQPWQLQKCVFRATNTCKGTHKG